MKGTKIKWRYLFISVMVITLFIGCQEKAIETQKEEKTLFAYVGANLKEPVTELVSNYEEETGIKIELTFNSSGALLNQLDIMKEGDIYMPGGMSFVNQADEKGHIDQVEGPVAYHTPVIITPKGNPANITSIYDLSKEEVELVIPDKEATAIGKTAYEIFDKAGELEAIDANVIANLETPAKVLTAIKMGQGNAGIVEYSNTFQIREEIEVIDIDETVNLIEQIPIATLVYTDDKTLAIDFANYVKENGPEVFKKYGFKTD